jgi:arsenate reductase
MNVLFLCTGNSARSIIAEAILNRLGGARLRAFSAGSHPRGEVNPHAIALLLQQGFDVTSLRSKSWDEFAASGAPPLDVIITVCDNAAGEVCPVWPGRPAKLHWSLADPAAAEPAVIAEAFAQTYVELQDRIQRFIAQTP